MRDKDYESMNLKDLRMEAKKRGIKYYYRLKKRELVEKLKKDNLKIISKDEIIEIINSNPRMSMMRKIASALGVELSRTMKKADIIERIKEKLALKTKKDTKLTSSSDISSRMATLKQPISAEEKKVSVEALELPKTYYKDKLVCLPVNPHWIHIYWDFSKETLEKLQNAKNVKLRIYDVTYIIFNGKNAHRIFEVPIDPIEVRNYYFNVPNARANYIAEIGLELKNEYKPLLRSNLVETPPSGPGNSREEIWIDLKSFKKTRKKSEGTIIKPVEKHFRPVDSSVNPWHYN